MEFKGVGVSGSVVVLTVYTTKERDVEGGSGCYYLFESAINVRIKCSFAVVFF